MASGTLRSRMLDYRFSVERRALLWLRELARRRGRIKPEATHLATGRRGEFEAMFFLRRQGYKIAERRWRARSLNGDLDLVAWDGPTLAIVEVKTRTRHDAFSAKSAINEAKRKMLVRMARAYTRSIPDHDRYPVTPRFDVVAVYLIGDRIECTLTRDALRPQR